MTITDIQGNSAEAYDLIMRKEFAWQILRGEKPFEFRSVSRFYVQKFLKPKYSRTKSLDDVETRKYNYVHFHDYGNTWFLDVRIDGIGYIKPHPTTLPFLHERNCHELDEVAQQYASLKENDPELPLLFFIEIAEVLNTSLAPLSDIQRDGKIKVDPVIPSGSRQHNK